MTAEKRILEEMSPLPPDGTARASGPILSGDARLLFGSRTIRLFAYGFLSVILVLYLVERGLSEAEVGLLLTLTLLGDTVVSLAITTRADRWGRKKTLALGAILMVASGIVFATDRKFASSAESVGHIWLR